MIGERFIDELIGLRDLVQKHDFICLLGNPKDPIKKQLKNADRISVDYTIIYGEDEAKEGVYAIKDMKTGLQQKIKPNELFPFLSNR